MAIEERPPEVPMPGSGVWFFDVVAVDCAEYDTDQELAKALQEGEIEGRHCTVKGGKGYTDASLSEIATLCAPV
jgi:hypothetical protein